MKIKFLENLGLIVNGISIPVYFLLISVIEDPLICPACNIIGGILMVSGLLMVIASIITLTRNRKKGLIDHGIYGMVRHPMYVGAMVIFMSWAFLFPHWLTILLSLINIVIVYWFIVRGDHQNLDIFGNEYLAYSKAVPKVNIVAGFLRTLK